MTIGSLFSGIGGLELGLEMSGLGEVVWQCEIDPYCQKVLAKHWPNVTRYTDVRNCNPRYADIICGGFPCQDVSGARSDKRPGMEGARSGLWVEFNRIVGQVRPKYVVIENVASGAKLWVDRVRNDLGKQGYESLPIPLSAGDVGAPHERKRVFIIARNVTDTYQGKQPVVSEHAKASGASELTQKAFSPHPLSFNPLATRAEGEANLNGIGGGIWPAGPPLCRVDDGIPNVLDRNRALGNAVVPRCGQVIGYIIQILESGPGPVRSMDLVQLGPL